MVGLMELTDKDHPHAHFTDPPRRLPFRLHGRCRCWNRNRQPGPRRTAGDDEPNLFLRRYGSVRGYTACELPNDEDRNGLLLLTKYQDARRRPEANPG